MKIPEAFERLYAVGFEPREGQIQMAEQAYLAFSKKQFAVLEGETGIGKTFAYLIAGLLALEPKQHLIIATATITLQAQLFEKDLPLILKTLELPLQATLAKGRQRYACPQKLLHLEQQTLLDLAWMGIEPSSESPESPKNPKHLKNLKNPLESPILLDLKKQFQARTWSGDLDILPSPLPEALKRQITTDSAGCSQQQCGYFSACPYFEMRRAQSKSPIIVTNHHVLLSDIELGTGSLLPSPEKCLYIIDEAHQFPDAAVSFFQGSLQLSLGEKWLQGLKINLENLAGYLAESPDILSESLLAADTLLGIVTPLHAEEKTLFLARSSDDARLQPLTPNTQTLLTLGRDHGALLYKNLSLLRKACLQDPTLQKHNLFSKIMDTLGYSVDRAQKTWRAFHLLAAPNTPPIAKWLESESRDHTQNLGPTLYAAMTSSQHFLPELFWDKIQNGAVLCSATLRALDRFDYFLQQTGLNHYSKMLTQAFKSGFVFENSVLNIPWMSAEPQGAELSAHYIQELVRVIEGVFAQEKHGVLVLFTSQKLLEKVYSHMASPWYAKILAQPDYGRMDLLKRHKKRVDEGQLSVIFGLQSFAEGVDLPGDYCRHVVITRLPFAVPTGAIERTWFDFLEQQGKNPFQEYTLPKTSIKLAQAVGRLIRRHSDTGSITLCDRRVISKPYGKTLLDTLPRFRRVIPMSGSANGSLT